MLGAPPPQRKDSVYTHPILQSRGGGGGSSVGTASPYIAKILPKFLIYCSVVFVQKIFKLVLAILLSIKKLKLHVCLYFFAILCCENCSLLNICSIISENIFYFISKAD